MNKYILITIFTIGLTCPTQKLKCSDLKTSQACNSTASHIAKCYWSEYNQSCDISSYTCAYYSTQSDCLNSYRCGWINNTCKEKQIEKTIYNCDSYSTYDRCIDRYNNGFCTWEHNKCIPVNKCSDVNDYLQCRNIRLKDRCQIVVNGKPSQMQKQFAYLSDIFDDFQCRSQDCVYNYYSDCPNFKNGRRCFQYLGGCTQCSYFTSKKECVDTNQCLWQDGCRNILCSDFTSKNLCSSKPYCTFNEQSLKCETRTDDQLYCYSYDIGSEPKKSVHRDF